MKDRIKLFWYRHPEGNGNFGDELNWYIVGNLSNNEIEQISLKYLQDNKWAACKSLLAAYYHNQINFLAFCKYLYYNFILMPKVLVAIGSVIQDIQYSNCQVWGAGIIDTTSNFSNADFVAVRGNYSQRRLTELGYKSPQQIGDPAILLPLLYDPQPQKKFKIGIIPHYVHFENFRKLNSADILVINLLDDIEHVINQISSCEFTLSTSLHGIIVSHVYGIPSVWVQFSQIKEKLVGDNVKFKDYFSSVGIIEYKALVIANINDLRKDCILTLLHDNHIDMLPDKKKIIQIQKQLLAVAPFSLQKKYKLYCAEF